jgi:hypothetical protein
VQGVCGRIAWRMREGLTMKSEQTADPRPATVILESPPAPTSAHYSEWPPSEGKGQLTVEYEHFRLGIAGWLAEGHEEKFVLIKGERLIGIYETQEEGLAEARRLFPGEAYLLHQILTYYPIVHGPLHTRMIWPMKRTRSARPTGRSSPSV